ncbi:neurochondrin isoform X2 [Cynara cardunculus var. scolymus]|uniref:neurochondrin isoform X2 n=1 Tax=Cynara cardunculus var. scolymus TaxID=59895 RepID=UPI000D625E69|nr:neurochondrin isoform X2 [Cynara cardunculus var. scolymus]
MLDVQEQQRGPSLEDCLKLLKGDRDEQRLAGLLLATKFCNNDDFDSILRVYNAVGNVFLDRLLRTGMGKGSTSESRQENRDAYLQLSVTILAAFCRVADIASSDDMVKKIPLVLEVLSKELGPSLVEECFEFLYLVSAAHKDGIQIFYESGGMTMLASQMFNLPDGSHTMEVAMKLLQLTVSKISLDTITKEYYSELSSVVTVLARQFAVLHNALKFEALHLLSTILSSIYAEPVHEILRTVSNKTWLTYVRVGVVAVLQNRVAPEQRLEALMLAESIMCIAGEGWLLGQMNLPDTQDPIPADRCILLVLESSRVEIAVLLNDLAYLKYEKAKDSLDNETFLLKQRNLGTAFSLVEKTIKLISSVAGDGGDIISDKMFTKIITGLNETVAVILEYLRDAKDHGQHKGNDLLASVRIVGSYLAETPAACNDKIRELLGYLVLVEGEDEQSPFSSVCFLLPMLCQITMEIDGCRLIASSGAYKAVVACLIKLLSEDAGTVEENGPIFLACDTILNLLLKIRLQLDDSYFIRLLGVLPSWAENAVDCSNTMMASSICALILDLTSEAALQCHPQFHRKNLISLSQLMRRSMAASYSKDTEADLLQIVISGYSRWVDRFPHVKAAVEGK